MTHPLIQPNLFQSGNPNQWIEDRIDWECHRLGIARLDPGQYWITHVREPALVKLTNNLETLLHELCHGWECKSEEILEREFGLDRCDLVESTIREVKTLGYQGGLLSVLKMRSSQGFDSRVERFMIQRLDLIMPGLPRDGYLVQYKKLYKKHFQIATNLGLDGLFESWRGKLLEQDMVHLFRVPFGPRPEKPLPGNWVWVPMEMNPKRVGERAKPASA